MDNAHPTLPSAAAPSHGAASSFLALLEARQLRDALRQLLRTEQAAMADFLVALADFDRRRGWEALGHASLFAFLVVELHLSRNSAYWRLSSARLIQRHPEVVEPLRDGRLCLSTTAELAKVLTSENLDSVLPRYYRLSAREAAEVTVELQPRAHPPLRTVVTNLEMDRPAGGLAPSPRAEAAMLVGDEAMTRTVGGVLTSEPTQSPSGSPPGAEARAGTPPRIEVSRDDVEPLTADLRRLHVTVSRQFLVELESARGGLAHAIPNATTEQVLQAALRLLLEKQARARGQVKKPRAALAVATPRVEAALPAAAPGVDAAPEPAPSQAPQESIPPLALIPTEPSPPRRTGPREAITAAVRRAVWERDGGRCCWPLDGGGVCGSTHRLELDHIVPWARFGGRTEENLRLTCARHNALAARQAFGARWMRRYQGGRGAR
jgi:hypothetical protein